jgi:hypothetical protein
MFFRTICILGVFYHRYTQNFWNVLNFCKNQDDIKKDMIVVGLLWWMDQLEKIDVSFVLPSVLRPHFLLNILSQFLSKFAVHKNLHKLLLYENALFLLLLYLLIVRTLVLWRRFSELNQVKSNNQQSLQSHTHYISVNIFNLILYVNSFTMKIASTP